MSYPNPYREPEFPQLTVLLHAGILYVGCPTIVDFYVGGGIKNSRACLSPCWVHEGNASKVSHVVNIANGEPSMSAGWKRCDGLSLTEGIVASMPITRSGIAAMCQDWQPFAEWIRAEDTRLNTARAAGKMGGEVR